MKKLFLVISLFFMTWCLGAQPSALVDYESTTQGILIPRMTETQRLAIASPDNGLLVFDITNKSVFYYDGPSTSWKNLGAGIFQQQNDFIFGGDKNDDFIVSDDQTSFNIGNTQTIGGLAFLNSKMFYVPDKAAFRTGTTSNDLSNPNAGAFNLAAMGDFSTSFGLNNMADGIASMVAGGGVNRASGIASAVIGGEGNQATGVHATVMGGQGNVAHDLGSTVMGQYNEPGIGSDSTWVPTDRLFTIGNGASDIARSNAVTVLKNGNMSIKGDTSTLHLVGPTSIYGYHGKLNFGDANYVYLKEHEDDKLEIYAAAGVTIRGQGHKIISPAELKASSNTQTYVATAYTAYGVSFNPEFFNLLAPIHLPQGTRIAAVDLWYDDTDASANLVVNILRTTPGSTTTQTVCSLGSTGSSGAGADYDGSPTFNKIDNSSYSYILRVTTSSNSSWTSTLQFKGLRIYYY